MPAILNQEQLSRTKRNNDFESFRENFKENFNIFLESDEGARKLKAKYSLYILNHTPSSILDKRGVISYFGKRPYETIFRNKSITNLSEEGASIDFEKGDDGYVTVKLFPAQAENYRQREDFIIVNRKLDPKRLKNNLTLKKYWFFFIAYMEVTSLDGSPSIFQLITVNYLRNFKNLIINNRFNNSRIKKHFLDISKFVLSVGLSGFLLFLLTMFFDKKQQDELKLFRSDFNEKIDLTNNRFKKIENTQEQVIIKLEQAIDNNSKTTKELLEKSLKNDSINNRYIKILIKNTTGNNGHK